MTTDFSAIIMHMIKVLEIVNRARRKQGKTDLTLEQYDNDLQADVIMAREAFRTAYRELINKGAVEFQYQGGMNIGNAHAFHEFPLPYTRIQNLDMYIYDGCCDKTKLRYAGVIEDGCNPVPTCDNVGMPTTWQFQLRSQGQSPLIKFSPTPDKLYQITFVGLENPEHNFSGNDITKCNDYGNEWLTYEIAYLSSEDEGQLKCSFMEQRDRALSNYINSLNLLEDMRLFGYNAIIPQDLDNFGFRGRSMNNGVSNKNTDIWTIY